MKLELAFYPSEVLRKKCEPFKKSDFNEDLIELIDGMFKVMYENNGIGLAAPQVNISKQILVIDLQIAKDKTENIFKAIDCNSNNIIENMKLVMINPEILEKSNEMDLMIEGCLSLPEIKVSVSRSRNIKVKFLDENGDEQIYFAEGLLAKAMQHEIAHLNGELIIDYPMNIIEKEAADKILVELEKNYFYLEQFSSLNQGLSL